MRSLISGFALAVCLVPTSACGDDGSGADATTGGPATGGVGGVGASGGAGGNAGASEGGTGGKAGGGPCPDGVVCLDAFPFYADGDTTRGSGRLDTYSCAPTTDEGGPEVVYRATVPTAGLISAVVRDGDAVDIDVHILSALDAGECLARGDLAAQADVAQGDVWIVADSWVDGAGEAQSGAYEIDIGFVAPSAGPCGMLTGEMPRVGDGGDHLAMPATGPIVQEAHLVTSGEPPPYPATPTEDLAAHFLLTAEETGLVMMRAEVWAPLEGGGTFYGSGIGDPADFPVAHEAYYVNMFWTPEARPPAGTRMILRRPDDPDRAVVVAAGYETGPSNLAHVGGTTEEAHFYLGTSHLDELELGIAEDQTLPIGPRRCD